MIVGLTAGLSYNSYTDENYCLLRHSTGDELPMIYYSFYLPIGRQTGQQWSTTLNHEFIRLLPKIIFLHFIFLSQYLANRRIDFNILIFLSCTGISILVNGAIFVAVVIKVFKKGRYQRFESKVQKLLSQIKAVCTLSCVLGLTWALGFLTFDHPADIVFHYLFTICNCIQG